MDIVYDLETFPNCFLLTAECADIPLRWCFEISERTNESRDIVLLCDFFRDTDCRMVGFNNIGFDYPILHHLLRAGRSDAATLYAKAQAIINSQDMNRWAHQVYPSDRVVPQIDLFKIHHFDNRARSTSLKALEFNMRADTIKDLPFPVGTVLTPEQIEVLRAYNLHDVQQTKAFYHHTLPMIRFREELTARYGRDFLNHNDTKIGKDFFIMQLERAGVSCYDVGPEGRTPRQTKRPSIRLADAILPWIEFQQPEFQRVLNWVRGQTITETKGVFKDLTSTINGFTFVFGTGGIHGSVENEAIHSDDEHVIVDLDVTSYYPTLAIANGFYPEHLGTTFVDIYRDLFAQRSKYPKGSPENAMLKLALNGVYGDSNNVFSVFYDPLYTMKITLNGQLLLCLLAERLMAIPGLRLIQTNTDGLTVRVAREATAQVEQVRLYWEAQTGLRTEEAIYRSLFVRDVNSYIGVHDDGTVKRKGAYDYEREWHQDASALVVPKVAELVLTQGKPIRQTVEQWEDKMDFMLRVKAPRNAYLSFDGKQVQNTTRYYVAKGGGELLKWLPPLAGKTEWRRIAVESGWGVCVCNDIKDVTLPVDFDYYVNECEKLTLGLA